MKAINFRWVAASKTISSSDSAFPRVADREGERATKCVKKRAVAAAANLDLWECAFALLISCSWVGKQEKDRRPGRGSDERESGAAVTRIFACPVERVHVACYFS